jgi:hypothetical protein
MMPPTRGQLVSRHDVTGAIPHVIGYNKKKVASAIATSMGLLIGVKDCIAFTSTRYYALVGRRTWDYKVRYQSLSVTLDRPDIQRRIFIGHEGRIRPPQQSHQLFVRRSARSLVYRRF